MQVRYILDKILEDMFLTSLIKITKFLLTRPMFPPTIISASANYVKKV